MVGGALSWDRLTSHLNTYPNFFCWSSLAVSWWRNLFCSKPSLSDRIDEKMNDYTYETRLPTTSSREQFHLANRQPASRHQVNHPAAAWPQLTIPLPPLPWPFDSLLHVECTLLHHGLDSYNLPLHRFSPLRHV